MKIKVLLVTGSAVISYKNSIQLSSHLARIWLPCFEIQEVMIVNSQLNTAGIGMGVGRLRLRPSFRPVSQLEWVRYWVRAHFNSRFNLLYPIHPGLYRLSLIHSLRMSQTSQYPNKANLQVSKGMQGQKELVKELTFVEHSFCLTVF
jgi:hypothetical protein